MHTTVGNLLAERIELGRALVRTQRAHDERAEAAALRCIADCLARLEPALRTAHVDREFVTAINSLFAVHQERYDGKDDDEIAQREDKLLDRLDTLAAR
jgi:hypothetical protein